MQKGVGVYKTEGIILKRIDVGEADSLFTIYMKDFGKIRAKILYVLSRTDRLFPPSLAPGVMDGLARAGVEARYVEIDSELGHLASGPEAATWGPALRDFLATLAP